MSTAESQVPAEPFVRITAEQNTPEWEAARLGIPTASSASKLLTGSRAPSKSQKAYAHGLAHELYAGECLDAWRGNAFTERGHEVEPEARAWLAFELGAEIEQLGFCVSTDGRAGCSVDGRLMSGDRPLTEFKCFPKRHMDVLNYFEANNALPPDELPQIHMQMMVMDAPGVWMCHYHPRLPKLLVHIARDFNWDLALSDQIDQCIELRDAELERLREMAKKPCFCP